MSNIIHVPERVYGKSIRNNGCLVLSTSCGSFNAFEKYKYQSLLKVVDCVCTEINKSCYLKLSENLNLGPLILWADLGNHELRIRTSNR